MQITLTQPEIEQALQDYVSSIITVRSGQDVSVRFSATRGENGITAIIDIVPGASQAKVIVPAAAVASAPAASTRPRLAPAPAPAPVTTSNVAPIRAPRTPAEVREMMAAEAAANPPEAEPGDETMAEELAREDAAATPANDAPAATEEAPFDNTPASSEPEPVAATGTNGAAPKRSLFQGLRKPVNG